MDELAPLGLTVEIAELSDDAVVLTVAGELDVYSAPVLDERLERAGERAAHHVIVDLTTVPLMDSVVLGVLMRHAKMLRARSSELLLVSDDPRTTRVLEITGLTYLFTIRSSLAEAVAGLPQAA
jgi:anti-sigma B factor antagonist